MTRYWLPIVILVLVISSIGTYYIQGGTSSHLPEFALIHKEGDVEEAKAVAVQGIYNQTRISPTVVIDLNGSQYSTRTSFLESMDPFYWEDEELQQLVKEYRDFMRGKWLGHTFYQDEQILVSVKLENGDWKNEEHHLFDISILQKSDGKTTEYKVPFSGENEYAYPYIQGIQVFGHELVMLISGTRKDSDRYEYLRYSLDLTDGELLSDEVVPLSAQENERVYLSTEENPTQSGRYVVIYTKPEERDTITSFMVYDLKSGELKTLQAPVINEFLEKQSNENSKTVRIVGNKLFVTDHSEEMRVLEYHLTDDQGAVYSIEIDDVVFSSQIENDRIYVLTQEKPSSPTSLSIVHLPTGEMLFEGTIELKEPTENSVEAMQKLDLGAIDIGE